MKWLVWAIVLFIMPIASAQEGSASSAGWSSLASAREGTIRLLALSERSDGSTEGLVADLDLRVEDGNNRVFLETFPLTKITTQISMRFAQQIACKELNIDCSDKDFFFTIRAMPGIVGGPSAGSAAAVLVASLIADLELKNDTAITGTINSGGVIGPVGGIKDKIAAAADTGLKRVLIPHGTRMFNDSKTNQTTDLITYGKELGLEVIEVSTLLDALHEYTGKEFPKATAELVIEPRYRETMEQIAIDLCDRTKEIRQLLSERRTNRSNTTDLEMSAANMTARSQDAFAAGQYYASASFCFRSSVQLMRALALQRAWNEHQIAKALLEIRSKAANYSREIDARNVSTITDLQTYMAVKERLLEVEDTFGEIVGKLNETKENAERLAYAEERYFSAVTWARFFDGDDKRFVINTENLHDSCVAKISEAEERINYVRSFLPTGLSDTRRDLDKAYNDLASSNHTLCLHKASKAKAEADVVLSLVGVEERALDDLIALKLGIVREAIIKSQQKGIFPIIGYSYYEYANSLKDLDKTSALLFSEYALELSNLDIYFPKKHGEISVWRIIKPHIEWILTGILIGWVSAAIWGLLQEEKKERRHRRN